LKDNNDKVFRDDSYSDNIDEDKDSNTIYGKTRTAPKVVEIIDSH